MRNLTSTFQDGMLTVYIEQDIDHHTAAALRPQIDELIARDTPRTLVLDFDSVEFMDSSGIGLILGRYRLLQVSGGKVLLQGLNPRCRRLVELSGILDLVEILEGGNRQ